MTASIRRLVPSLFRKGSWWMGGALVLSLATGLAACSAQGTATPTAAMDSNASLAKVGTASITLADVDAKASAQLAGLKRQEYEIRRRALDELIDEKLVELEASTQKISKEELLQKEVVSKVVQPSAEEIQMVYQMNRERIGDTPFEEVQPKIVAFMMERKTEEAKVAFFSSLRTKHPITDTFSAPRTEVSVDDDAFKGPKDAPITIVEFSDFECPYCSKAIGVVDEVVKKYEGKVKLVFRDFPLDFHQNAKGAAMAAQCANEKGKFWEMHDAMFKDQSKLDNASLVATAKGLGLDEASFQECLSSNRFMKEVEKDMEDGKRAGVTGTPAFFVNGVMIEGAQPLEEFSKVIDAELARAGK